MRGYSSIHPLARVQQLVLETLKDETKPLPLREVHRRVYLAGYRSEPHRVRDAVAHAVQQLIPQGFVAGYFRGFCRYEHGPNPVRAVEDVSKTLDSPRTRRPRLAWLELTDKGRDWLLRNTRITKSLQSSRTFPQRA